MATCVGTTEALVGEVVGACVLGLAVLGIADVGYVVVGTAVVGFEGVADEGASESDIMTGLEDALEGHTAYTRQSNL